MLYRELGRTGEKVSILGYGCMRFPTKNRRIDIARTERQILAAVEAGVNYFDTAYTYPGSESTLGGILAKGRRQSVMIATKMPLPLVHSYHDMENTLDTQLKRLRTDHLEFYLMHGVMSFKGWQRIKQLGVVEFLEKAKQAGKIRHIGFSFHGDIKQFKELIDDYPWEFCQIQYNYMDEHFQAGKEGLHYASSKGLGVIVMEPLRGGTLTGKLPAEIRSIFDQSESKKTLAEWGLRWVWNHPEVSLVLSGMNEEQHVAENLRIAQSALPNSLTPEDMKTIDQVKARLKSMLKVGCTGCGYCSPCPSGVSIATCFSLYNNRMLLHDGSSRLAYLGYTTGMDSGKPSYASLCKGCGECEEKCPQKLPIREDLKLVAKEMQPFYFRSVVLLAKGYYKFRKLLSGGK